MIALLFKRSVDHVELFTGKRVSEKQSSPGTDPTPIYIGRKWEALGAYVESESYLAADSPALRALASIPTSACDWRRPFYAANRPVSREVSGSCSLHRPNPLRDIEPSLRHSLIQVLTAFLTKVF